MPDLRSVRSIPIGEGRKSRSPLASPFSTHGHRRAASRPQKPFPPAKRGGALITLAAGRRTVPSMHFSRPRRHDRPADAAPRGGGRRGEGGALGRPPPPCEPLAPPQGRRRGAGRGGRVDAQADMPLDEPRAQVAFKDSMIRGILQFTLRIAFRCVLHRCKSQDIRC